MAILKHIPVKSSNYGHIQRYLVFQHDEYTQKPILDENGDMIFREGYLIDSLNCNPFTFNTECTELNRQWHKNLDRNDRKAHHYIISFDPRDVQENGLTSERVQAIGMEFANLYFAGHQVLIATHTDGNNHSGNLHCHIVLNSLRKLDIPWQDFMEEAYDAKAGYKHHPTDKLTTHMHNTLNAICEREHLHTLDNSLPTDRKVSTREYWGQKRGQKKLDVANQEVYARGLKPRYKQFNTTKEQLRQMIDKAVVAAQDERDFIRIMLEKYGVAIRTTRGTISYKPAGRKQAIRGTRLGRIYERAQIIERIAGVQQSERQRPEFVEMPRIFFIHSDLRLVVDLQNCVKAQQSRAYARKVELSNLQEMARTVAYIQEHGMGTIDKLVETAQSAEVQYTQASDSLRSTQNELRAVNAQIHYTGQYLSHKAVYRQFLSSSDKGAFRTMHRAEIDEYEEAVRQLKAVHPDGNFTSMKELKSEKARLAKLRYQQKNALSPLSDQRSQMRVITKNVEAILGRSIVEREHSSRRPAL